MKFEYDLFINYPVGGKAADKESAEALGNYLTMILSRMSKHSVKVAYSHDFVNNNLAAANIDFFGKVGAFITIITNDYSKNDTAVKELESFYMAAQNMLGLEIDGRKRIFKIDQTNVPIGIQPSKLQELLSYDFFERDTKSNQIKEFEFKKSGAQGSQYWNKLVDLAFDISKVLFGGQKSGTKSTDKKTLRSIFLAETTPDQSAIRDNIKRELQSHGFRVLPLKPLSKVAADLEKSVLQQLDESILSIHIIGEHYGDHLDQSKLSAIDAQNRIAASYVENLEKTKNKTFPRLVYINPELVLDDDQQKLYIEKLKRDIDALKGAEIIQTPLEMLKSVIENKLNDNSQRVIKASTSDNNSGSKKKVYLINDQSDKDKVNTIEQYLKSKNIDVLPSVFEGNQMDLIGTHRKNLAECDGIMIYTNQASEQWVNVKLSDSRKAPGFGRTKPILAKVLFMDRVKPEVRSHVKATDINIIENNGEFSPESLKSFIEKLTN